MAVFTRGIIVAILGLIMLGSYISATQGWMVSPLRNPSMVRQSERERDSLNRYHGTHSSSGGHIYTSNRSYRSNARTHSSTNRSFRGGSMSGRGK